MSDSVQHDWEQHTTTARGMNFKVFRSDVWRCRNCEAADTTDPATSDRWRDQTCPGASSTERSS